jgi:hypothetical protein
MFLICIVGFLKLKCSCLKSILKRIHYFFCTEIYLKPFQCLEKETTSLNKQTTIFVAHNSNFKSFLKALATIVIKYNLLLNQMNIIWMSVGQSLLLLFVFILTEGECKYKGNCIEHQGRSSIK